MIEVKETDAGGVKQVSLLFRTSVEIEKFQVPGQCKVLQYGQSSLNPYSGNMNVGVYVEGNGCDEVVKRLKGGLFQVTYTDARSGVGEDLAPVEVLVRAAK